MGITSIITKTGVLDEDVLKNDIQLLTAYYFESRLPGCKDFRTKIDLSNPKKIRIEIEVAEGLQYRSERSTSREIF